jgi:GNAT superfamily N-acetyltransferase
MLRIYTARLHDGKLIGYAVFLVNTNAHYAGSLQAVQDVLYIDPEHRRGHAALRLLHFSEAELRDEGVQCVYHHVKLNHPALGVLLERMGYAKIETIYGRRLDR